MVTMSGRECVRCGLELTDAASMEVGIGPICRKRDNALLARSIPSNINKALAAIEAVPGEKLDPAAYPTFLSVIGALTAPDAVDRLDWRQEVKRLEWVLSFPLNKRHALKELTAVVDALGYTGLAALWAGEASVGIATCRYSGGRLWVAGPRNGHFRVAFRKLGGMFHATTKEWSVVASKAEEFEAAIHRFYPINMGLAEALAAAKAAPAAEVATAPTTAKKAAVRAEADGAGIRVYTPYNVEFIAGIKKLPYPLRKWNPAEKCWWVADAGKEAALALVKAVYGVDLTPAATAPAPAPVVGGTILPF